MRKQWIEKTVKKTLALLLATVLLSCGFGGVYAEESLSALNADRAAAFEALGLIDSAESYISSPSVAVSKQELCEAAAVLLNLPGTSEGDAVSLCEEAGIISSSVGSGTLTCKDAADVFAKALCMDILHKQNEKSFEKVLSSYRNSILKETKGGNATRADLIAMLNNVTRLAAVNVEAYSADGITVSGEAGETLLYKYSGIYTVTAVVKANDRTSLISAAGCAANHVKLDDSLYSVGATDIDNALGSRVYAFVQENAGGEDEVIAYYEQNGTELIIDGEDIVDAKAYSVTYSEGGRIYTKNFSRYISVIYNGKMTDTLSKELLLAKSGSLRFIDNDKDGGFDVAIIEQYEDYIVDSIDWTKEMVYGRDGKTPFSINEDDYAIVYSLTGEAITRATFEKIVTNGDVLSIAKSRGGSGKQQLTIKIGFDKIDGTLTGMDLSEKTIQVNNKSYTLSYDFAQSSQATAFSLGDSVRLYLNGLSRVCAIEAGESSRGEEYAYLLNAGSESGLSEGGSFKLFDLEGNTVIVDGAEKINFNESSKTPREVVTALTQGGFTTQLVRVQKDSDGKLSRLKTAVTGKSDTQFSLDVIMNSARYYSDQNYMFASRSIDSAFTGDYDYDVTELGVEYSVGPDAKMLYIFNRQSDGLIADKGLQWIDQLGSQEQVSTVHMYDIDDCGIAAMAVVESSSAVLSDYANKNYSFTVVEKVTQSVDEDGEEYLKMTVWRDRKQQEFKLTQLKVTECLDGTNDVETEYPVSQYAQFIQPGDVLQVIVRGDEIIAMRRIFTFTQKPAVNPDKRTVYAEDGVNERVIRKNSTLEPTAHDTVAIYGRVAAKDGVQTVLLNTTTLDSAGNSQNVQRVRRINPQQACMYKLEYGRGCTVSTATYNDIVAGKEAGSLVLLHSRNAKIMDMIIIQNNNQ